MSKALLQASLIIDSWCIERTFQMSGNRVFPNTHLNRYEADIFEVSKSGYLYEYEVKVSHSDFLAEKKKIGKWDKVISGERTNYFYYLCPEGVISPEEVPEYAGLIYVTGIFYSPMRKMGNYEDQPDWNIPHIHLRHVKSAPKLSKLKLGNKYMDKLLESTYRRFHSHVIWDKYKIPQGHTV